MKDDVEPVIGFLDESSLRTDPSRRRVIDTPVVRYTDKGEKYAVRSMTFFGFMSLNGNDVVMASESARAFDTSESISHLVEIYVTTINALVSRTTQVAVGRG